MEIQKVYREYMVYKVEHIYYLVYPESLISDLDPHLQRFLKK